MHTTITLHSGIDTEGNRYKYARIIERSATRIMGCSVLLHRLSPEQLSLAKPEPVA